MRKAADIVREIQEAINRDRVSYVSLAVHKFIRERLDEAERAGQTDPLAEQARELIGAERSHQDAKWGEQDHDPQVWMAILGEEFGELCQAANDLRWPKVDPPVLDIDHMLNEAVQTAAVAQAIVECLLRAAWQWPRSPLTSTTEVSNG